MAEDAVWRKRKGAKSLHGTPRDFSVQGLRARSYLRHPGIPDQFHCSDRGNGCQTAIRGFLLWGDPVCETR